MSAFRVTAPLVIAYNKDGSTVHVYQGGFLPEGLAAAEVKRLEEGGFVESFGDDAPAKRSTSK